MRLHKKDDDLNIIILGIVLAILVIGLGIAAYYGVNFYLDQAELRRSREESARLSEEMREEIGLEETGLPKVTETPAITAMPENTASETPGVTIIPGVEPEADITELPTPEPEIPLYAYVSTRSSLELSYFTRAQVSSALASSTLVQEDTSIDNSVYKMFDGDETTSWQEGAEGRGEGQAVYMRLDRSYEVSRITFKLGNWRSEANWASNCRPMGMTIWLDGLSFEVTFPDGMTEYCVVFSKDVTASEVYIRIDSVYIGEHDDTCISEMGIYGW